MDSSIFSLVTVFFTFAFIILTFIDRQESKEKKREKKRGLLSDRIGIGLTAFGALALISAFTSQVLKDIEDQAKENELKSLNEEIAKLQLESTEKLDYQYKFLTGDTSFPVIYLKLVGKQPSSRWQVGVIGQGKYPLRNLSWNIFVRRHGEEHRVRKNVPKSDYMPGVWNEIVGQLVSLDNDHNAQVRVVFSAFNGRWIQRIQFGEDETGKLQYSSRLYEYDRPNQPIFVKGFTEVEILETIVGPQTPR